MSWIRVLAGVMVLGLCCAVGGITNASPMIGHAGSVETTAAPDRPIDLNAADEQRLMSVPGIGRTLAARIIEFRKKHGPFKRVDDLLKVKGIGEKSFEKLRPYFTVDESR